MRSGGARPVLGLAEREEREEADEPQPHRIVDQSSTIYV
jgi:hypothetical protein